MSEPGPIVSVHVPKTGGVSFREVLAELAGEHIVFDYDDRPLAPAGAWTRLRRRLARPTLPPGTRVVHGHFVASKYRALLPTARFVTWFRDPVERLASHYHYWLREPDPENATCRKLLDEKLSLPAFAALPEMRDVHARFLGGIPVERFAFVGLTEHYDEAMALFARLFGIERPLAAGRANTNPERTGDRYDLAPELRRELASLNRADVLLHEQAVKRFEALRAGIG